MNDSSGRVSGLKVAVGLIFGLCVAVLLVGTGIAYFPTVSNQGYMPEQPIPFSHSIHAGANKIACAYCHSEVEKSRHASVPALSTCMNCHSVVRLDSPHIQALNKAYREKKPIEWVRVHELADYVYFPHKWHVAAGLSCETCHGDVKNMAKISQHASLTMGWCMDCHRGRTTPQAVLAKLQSDGKSSLLPKGHVAAVNCTTCHN